MEENGTLRQLGIHMASGIIAGVVVVVGIAVMWGSIQTRLDRAIGDIEILSRTIYTQRDAAMEMRAIYDRLGRLASRVDELQSRLIRIESNDRSGPPGRGTRQ